MEMCDCFKTTFPHTPRTKDEKLLEIAQEDVNIPAEWTEGW